MSIRKRIAYTYFLSFLLMIVFFGSIVMTILSKVVPVQSAYVVSLVFVLASIALLVFFFISIYISKKVTEPILNLQKEIELISKGKEFRKIDLDLSDEVGEVIASFNKMVSVVQDSQSHVDQRVKKQTEDIRDKQSFMEDQQKAILNILEDVADEKKKSENLAQDLVKFKQALNYASDHIVITDTEGIVIYANQAVEKITGFTEDEVLGNKAGGSRLWGGLMKKEEYKEFWDTIKNKKKSFHGEFRNRKKNGQEYIAEAHVSPVLDQSGNVRFFIGIERDVTKAKEVDRMKTEFISLASHQLRTPLSAMKWFLEMLMAGDAGKLNKEQKEFVDNINVSNERMIDLVNSLLNISRIESGRIIIDPHPTDLEKLVKEVIKELQPTIKDKKIKITAKITKNLPKIKVDPSLIREVYKNLLTNAIKYSPEKSEVKISLTKKKKDIVSQIDDQGIGIPLDQQEKVFTKFFRADNVTQHETDGTGLGLYLVKSILNSSGGKVGFSSKENKGSSFWFSLPLSGSKKQDGEVRINS